MGVGNVYLEIYIWRSYTVESSTEIHQSDNQEVIVKLIIHNAEKLIHNAENLIHKAEKLIHSAEI